MSDYLGFLIETTDDYVFFHRRLGAVTAGLVAVRTMYPLIAMADGPARALRIAIERYCQLVEATDGGDREAFADTLNDINHALTVALAALRADWTAAGYELERA